MAVKEDFLEGLTENATNSRRWHNLINKIPYFLPPQPSTLAVAFFGVEEHEHAGNEAFMLAPVFSQNNKGGNGERTRQRIRI